MIKYLDKLERLVGEYSDTIYLILLVGGSLLMAFGVGDLPRGGTTNGYSFAYLKHPFLLQVGLVATVVGFVGQLWENLSKTHGVHKKYLSWPLAIIFILLLLLVATGAVK